VSTAEIGANLEKEETLKFFLAKNTASDLTTTISKPLPKVVASNSNSACTGSKTELTAKAMAKSYPTRKKSKYAPKIEETETKRDSRFPKVSCMYSLLHLNPAACMLQLSNTSNSGM
jgi:hypothetical protein